MPSHVNSRLLYKPLWLPCQQRPCGPYCLTACVQVLADAAKYAPGATLPPHLSPFVKMEAADEEEHVPDYALELRRLQVGPLEPHQSPLGRMQTSCSISMLSACSR